MPPEEVPWAQSMSDVICPAITYIALLVAQGENHAFLQFLVVFAERAPLKYGCYMLLPADSPKWSIDHCGINKHRLNEHAVYKQKS